MKAARVLGVDPGTRSVGWAVLRLTEVRPERLASGTLRLGDSSRSHADRLLLLRSGLQQVLADWRPQLLALESAYFGKNARSALRLGEARGAILVTAREAELEILEIPPAQVKRRVAGAGAATKEQVARLVHLQLELTEELGSADESDALAVALCACMDENTARQRPPDATPPVVGARRRILPDGARWQ